MVSGAVQLSDYLQAERHSWAVRYCALLSVTSLEDEAASSSGQQQWIQCKSGSHTCSSCLHWDGLAISRTPEQTAAQHSITQHEHAAAVLEAQSADLILAVVQAHPALHTRWPLQRKVAALPRALRTAALRACVALSAGACVLPVLNHTFTQLAVDTLAALHGAPELQEVSFYAGWGSHLASCEWRASMRQQFEVASPDVSAHVGRFLRSLPNLRALTVLGKALDGNDVVPEAVCARTMLTELRWTYSQCRGSCAMYRQMWQLQLLAHLDFSNSRVRTTAAQEFASALLRMTQLQHLDLFAFVQGAEAQAQAAETAWRDIGAALCHLSVLTYLDVSGSLLNAHAAAALQRSVVAATALRALHLPSTGSRSSLAACSELVRLTQLTALHVRGVPKLQRRVVTPDPDDAEIAAWRAHLQHQNASEAGHSTAGSCPLLWLIAALSSLQTLELLDLQLRSGELSFLIRTLPTALTELTLQGQVWLAPALLPAMPTVTRLGQLASLTLCKGSVSRALLPGYLTRCTSLTGLVVEGIDKDNFNGLNAVTAALHSMPRLASLQVTCSGDPWYANARMVRFVGALSQTHSTLTKLDISGSRLRGMGAACFGRLSELSRLQELCLFDAERVRFNVKHARALASLTLLQRLDLGRVHFTEAGTPAFAAALGCMPGMVCLVLTGMGWTAGSVQPVLQQCGKMRRLAQLHLSDNDLAGAGPALADALAPLTSLRRLYVQRADLLEDDVIALAPLQFSVTV